MLAEASHLVGTFDKPRFIDFHGALCAHSRSRITGCTRCLEICPTGAIASAGDHVAIGEGREASQHRRREFPPDHRGDADDHAEAHDAHGGAPGGSRAGPGAAGGVVVVHRLHEGGDVQPELARQVLQGVGTGAGAGSLRDVKHYKRRKRWLS